MVNFLFGCPQIRSNWGYWRSPRKSPHLYLSIKPTWKREAFSQTRVNKLCKPWCDKHLDVSDTNSVAAWHLARHVQAHTSVLCSACHSSCEVCIFLSPTAEPPHLDPWWRTPRSPPARRSPPDTPPSATAPEWSATAGSVWTRDSTQACRPSPGRRTLGRGDREKGEDEGLSFVPLLAERDRCLDDWCVMEVRDDAFNITARASSSVSLC